MSLEGTRFPDRKGEENLKGLKKPELLKIFSWDLLSTVGYLEEAPQGKKREKIKFKKSTLPALFYGQRDRDATHDVVELKVFF